MSLRPLFCCCVILLAVAARGQPATAPAGVIPADQSTPRGALKMLTIAMNNGDADAIKAVFAPSSPLEEKMVETLVIRQQAEAKFRKAAINAFGADDARPLIGNADMEQAQSLAGIEAAVEQITGDEATINIGEEPLKFKKQNGKWTLPLPKADPASVNREYEAVQEKSKYFNDLTREIAEGRYKDAAEAGKALHRKFLQRAMTKDAAATQPATAPATPSSVAQ